MSQEFVSEVGTFIVPGAYVDTTVRADQSGIAASGIVLLIGEADAGAPGALESLEGNTFGPDELPAIIAKYKSGPIVDAFRSLISSSRDNQIQGAVSSVLVYKTNASLKASGSIVDQGFGSYGTLADLSYGQLGNLISWTSLSAQDEAAPQTDPFTYIPTPSGAALAVRVDGGAKASVALTALESPTALAAALEAVSGVLAQGGVDRDVLSGKTGLNLAVTVVGNYATFTLAAGSVFAATPAVGDTLLVPLTGDYGAGADSAYKGGTGENRGAYMVTGVSNTASLAAITALKVRNSTATPLTAPAPVTATAILATSDILVFSPINVIDINGQNRNVLTGLVGISIVGVAVASRLTLTLTPTNIFAAAPQVGDILTIDAGSVYAGGGSENVGHYEVVSVSNTASSAYIAADRLSNGLPTSVTASVNINPALNFKVLRPVVDGLGKSMELYDDAGAESVDLCLFDLGTADVASFLSTALAPQLVESAAEYVNRLGVSRKMDNVQDVFDSGGDVALKIGYAGTTASVTVGASTITTAVTGGVGSNLSLTIADFATLSDLAAYISAQTGYAAVLGSNLLGQKSPALLDKGTFGICSELGSLPGRVKMDLADFKASLANARLVSFAAVAAAGLPEARVGTFYLSGGAKGATSGAMVQAGYDAAKGITCNFVVPLFSRDYTLDIADGLTDSGSTYTIDAVNAGAVSHVLAMSTVKQRKHRQCFLSKDASFDDQKLAAQNLSSLRASLCFQNPTALTSEGTLKVYQSWMLAVIAAGMQAAAFRKAIVRKFMNVSGISHAAGDYDQNTMSMVEDALKNGLLPAERVTGGFRWVSDQTTYSFDSNFVFNSIQAVYAADIVALSLAQSADRAFTGQSVADITAAVAVSFVKARMNEFLRLKLIAASSDAPLGFKNVVVRLNGPALMISLEIKLATAIYFIPISITISQVTQEATA